MSIFTNTLLNKSIQDFIVENHRAPSQQEVISLRNQLNVDYPVDAGLPIIATLGETVKFREVSSASKENSNRLALIDDLDIFNKTIRQLTLELNDSYGSLKSVATKTNKQIKKLESRLDNLLLLSTNTNPFLYGIEETFTDHEYVDFESTSASVENGYVSLGKSSVDVLSSSNFEISYTTTAEKALIGTQQIGSLSDVLNQNSKEFQLICYSKEIQNRTSLVLNVNFFSNTYVGEFKLNLNPLNIQQRLTCTVLYSTDSVHFEAIEPFEIAIENSELLFSVAKDNVKTIQIVLSKQVTDTVALTGDQYVTMFYINGLTLYTHTYTAQTKSLLFCGPYFIVNENDEAVLFNKVQLSACCRVPADTFVSFYVSKDNLVWYPISWHQDANSIVQFTKPSQSWTSNFISLSDNSDGLLTFPDLSIDTLSSDETYINEYISSDHALEFVYQNSLIKRNTRNSDSIGNVPSGWELSDEDATYSTTVYINNTQGKEINLGKTSIILDGKSVTGLVLIPYGYHTISTNEANWRFIEPGAGSLETLKQRDPLYPYNHKYIIEGYSYGFGYSGSQVYSGVDDFFGYLLEYVSPEDFASRSFDKKIYTIDIIDDNFYFKVKIDKTVGNWYDETYDIEPYYTNGLDNLIYVKAELETNNINVTPLIEHFMLKVI